MKNKNDDKQLGGISRRGFFKLGGSAACLLGLGAVATAGGTLFSPEVAYATVEGDQTPLTDEEIEAAIQSGEIMTEFPESPIATYAATNYAVRTIAGSSRYETNQAQVLSAFSGCEWAIVASGEGYADSICAAGLAGALGCPIILTESSRLSDTASNCIRSIGASNVLLLGSTKVASEQVESSLRSLVSGTVERLWGGDRYATQMAVYQYGVDHGLWTGDLAIVSNATGFADALAISPISYKYKAPVFYVDGSNYFPPEQEQAVRTCGKTRFLITGDTKVMSASVETLLTSLGASVKRLSGSDRYRTSLAIAQYAVSSLGMSWDGAAITSGSAPYDALGGGPVQGKENSVIVLMEEDDYHFTPFDPFGGVKPSYMKFFGDKAIYSSAYKTRFALARGYKLTDIEGLRVYIDAGHGGYDPGASGSGYQEYKLTAELAGKAGSYLQSYGIPSYVNTKGNDYKLRHPEAKAMDCGAFVSIHFNASGGSGTESYVHSANSAAGSRTLQRSIHTRLVSALGLTDRGQLDAWFAVVSGPLPSVLLEICFIDRASDMGTYQSRKEAVAQAIAQGIAEA